MIEFTPKEKAEELLDQFGLPPIAIAAVDLLLSELPDTLLDEQERYKFWENVKIELETGHSRGEKTKRTNQMIQISEKQFDRAEQAVKDGEVHYCPNCKKVQPIELTMFNPDEDTEPSLIVCLVCKESIGFIENL